MNNINIPADQEAEQAVLGSIIENNSLLDDIQDVLTPNSFFLVAHQYIYRAMLDLVEMNYPIDEVLLGDQLKSLSQLEEIGGYAYLAELIECAPSSGNIEFYARIVAEHATLRDLIETTKEIGEKSRDPEVNIPQLIEEASEKIGNISDRQSGGKTIIIKDSLSKAFQTLEKTSENPDELIGLPTGFIDLDKRTLGLIPKDLIILAARTSIGKTAMALNIVSYLITKSNERGAILYVSKEMSDEQLAMRLIASEANVPLQKIRKGDLRDQDDWDKLAMATDVLSGGNLHINESIRTMSELKAEARKLHRKKEGLALIVIDYLQQMEGIGNNREQEVAYISRSLKQIAMEFNIPVIALSQLNRAVEKRTDKRPMLADLRESGGLENDSDIILFIYRDEVYNPESPDKGQAEIIIAKHRNGPTGMVRLAFVGKYAKFANLALHEL